MARAVNGKQGSQKAERHRAPLPPLIDDDLKDDEHRHLFSSPSTEPIIRMASILGRAHVQCAVSGLRFGFKATRRLLQGQSRLFNHLRDSERTEEFGQATLRLLVDETRGCLRDIAETSTHEVRRLQSELSDLQDATRELVRDESESARTYKRRWKAKS